MWKIKMSLNTKKVLSWILILAFALNSVSPYNNSEAWSDEIIYPLKQISKLECRFNDYDTLGSECKQDLPILTTKDYVKYATQNGWYNDYTRLYTMLWWASYTYGWDIWHWWHMWVDIATAKWTPVYAMAWGTVIIASNLGSLWNTVAIKHTINWKTIVSSYSHMSKINVSKWDTVSVWRQVWEVGSTWNSTWNHLHFQIDIDTKSSPAYYSYDTCPYSYYKITEEWACFPQLQKLTVDPLLFLETNWAILNNLPSYEKPEKPNKPSWGSEIKNWIDMSVFDRTVNDTSNSVDIKYVQNIMSDLWYYKWAISWVYSDVFDSIIDFQIARWVIANTDDAGTWNFWPKTRKQAKIDYEAYLKSEWKDEVENIDTWNEDYEDNNDYEDIEIPGQIIIEKDKLLTREEIEAIEVEDFMKDYNIELNFKSGTTNVAVWWTEILNLTVTDKKKWKPFVWNMPWGMSFVLDQENIDLFPTKLFNFTDWKREIEITWLKEWTTQLHIKVGNVTVKVFTISIFNWNKTIYAETTKLISPWAIILWDSQTALTFFRSWNNTLLVNIPFSWTYKLKASEWNKVCIKSWKRDDIKDIVNTKCNDSDFKEEIEFNYDDTVAWILVYDFKAFNKNASYQVINTYNNKVLSKKEVALNQPKWLTTDYEYRNDIVMMLANWVVSWIKSWYFEQDKDLNEHDAYSWLINSLEDLKTQTANTWTIAKLEKNISEVKSQQKSASLYAGITRKQFLDLSYKYLILDWVNVNVTINYKDLTEQENKIANYIFNSKTTWKDEFGNYYFQPDKNMTRWEWAFMLATVFNNYSNKTLTLK